MDEKHRPSDHMDEKLNTNVAQTALLICGQPRTGKSFLANCLLGRDVFEHRLSSRPVTKRESFVETQVQFSAPGLGDSKDSKDSKDTQYSKDSQYSKDLQNQTDQRSVSLWDVQGFGELGGANIERNRASWNTPFERSKTQIVLFLIQHQNGRLRAEDVELFVQMMNVYQLHPDSTLVVCNEPPPEAENPIGWLFEMKTLFVKASGFDRLKHFVSIHNVPRSNMPRSPNSDGGKVKSFDFGSVIAHDNALVIHDALTQCIPQSHVRNGQMTMTEERMSIMRARIDHIEASIQQERAEHDAYVEGLRQRITEIENHVTNLQGQYTEMTSDHLHHMNAIAAFERETESNHAQLMNKINQSINEIECNQLAFLEELEQARAQYRQAKRDRRHVGRILKAYGRAIRHKPATAIPLVLGAVFVPLATPMLMSAWGCSAVVAGATLGAGVGAVSSLILEQNIIRGTIAGFVTGGAGGYAVPLTMAPTIAINASAAAVGAAITNGDKSNIQMAAITAGVGSAIGSCGPVKALSGPGVSIITQIAVSAAQASVSHAAAALLVDRKNITVSAVNGFINGAVQGVVYRVAIQVAPTLPSLFGASHRLKTHSIVNPQKARLQFVRSRNSTASPLSQKTSSRWDQQTSDKSVSSPNQLTKPLILIEGHLIKVFLPASSLSIQSTAGKAIQKPTLKPIMKLEMNNYKCDNDVYFAYGGSQFYKRVLAGVCLYGNFCHSLLRRGLGSNILSKAAKFVGSTIKNDGDAVQATFDVAKDKYSSHLRSKIIGGVANAWIGNVVLVSTIIDSPAMREQTENWIIKRDQYTSVANDPSKPWFERVAANNTAEMYHEVTIVPLAAEAITTLSDYASDVTDQLVRQVIPTLQKLGEFVDADVSNH